MGGKSLVKRLAQAAKRMARAGKPLGAELRCAPTPHRPLGVANAVIPKGGWCLTGCFAEDSIKMGRRLETDGIRNLTDTEVRV